MNFDILLSVFWVWAREGLKTQGVTPSRGKRLFSKLTPRNNMSSKKIILLLIGHTKYTKHVRFYLPFFLLYIVYSQHAPLPSVILHALPDHLHTVLLVSYRIYIMYGSAVRM